MIKQVALERALLLLTALTSSLASFLVGLLVFCVVGFGAAFSHGEGGSGETVGEVDLGADRVCEVGDEENVLNVGVARKLLANDSAFEGRGQR